jgi:hypothetical protein
MRTMSTGLSFPYLVAKGAMSPTLMASPTQEEWDILVWLVAELRGKSENV